MADITVTFSKATPAEPAGARNVEWQSDGAENPHISANVKLASSTVEGIVKLANDLSGTSLLPVVSKIQGTPIKAGMVPADGDVLTWSGANSRWENLPAGGGGGGDASSLRGVNISTSPVANRNGQVLTCDGSNWRPYFPEPYACQEAHADMSGNSVGMYSLGSGTGRWATNGAGGTTRIDATATEKMLFQFETPGFGGGTALYGCNQSLHVEYTLGNTKNVRGRHGLLATTAQRFYFGLSDWTNSGSPGDWNTDTPNQNFVGFCFSSNAGDTDFMMVCQTDSTHQTRTASGVAIDSAMHVFEFYYDGSAVQFYIDGANVGSVNTNMPTTATRMDQITVINQTGATTRKINMDFVAVYQ